MASTAPTTHLTPEAYLARERLAETRSEYYDGRAYAMAGASFRHNVLLMNLSGELYAQLKGGPCQPCVGDVRLGIDAAGAFTHPDLMVVCGGPRFRDGEFDTVLNPTVIIEVLSPSTESWDRGGKFDLYRTLETLRDYVLVSQDRRRVERFTRRGEDWAPTTWDREDDVLTLESIACRIPLRDLYRNVAFD